MLLTRRGIHQTRSEERSCSLSQSSAPIQDHPQNHRQIRWTSMLWRSVKLPSPPPETWELFAGPGMKRIFSLPRIVLVYACPYTCPSHDTQACAGNVKLTSMLLCAEFLVDMWGGFMYKHHILHVYIQAYIHVHLPNSVNACIHMSTHIPQF